MPDQENDQKIKKILTLPNLVTRELICALIVTGLFSLAAIFFNAPLEDLPSPTRMPSPTKAPWYFLGLQELLVYFDPWLAGVIIPSLIVVGLCAVPYVDANPKEVGRFDYSKRKVPMLLFTLGMVVWFGLIIVGEFFRGPSWLWYWPWESWEIHKEFPAAAISLPNWAGLMFIAIYFGAGFLLPIKLASGFYKKLGPVKYFIQTFFMLAAFGVLLKIFLRLAFNIKYILQTPWFNV